mmetsp:Transcript_64202/g.187856  ORF Transcript_64202/g.187856 Transcript_64202/m.187856 type:complete len:303 (-) Transcript_64202:941-1849(-)
MAGVARAALVPGKFRLDEVHGLHHDPEVPLVQRLQPLEELLAVQGREPEDRAVDALHVQLLLHPCLGSPAVHHDAGYRHRRHDHKDEEGHCENAVSNAISPVGGEARLPGRPDDDDAGEEEAEVHPDVEAAVEHVPPGPEEHRHERVAQQHRHDPVDLADARDDERGAEVQQHALGHEDERPPVHVGPVADEEEAPALPHVLVVQVVRGAPDGPREEQAEAHAPAEHGQDSDGRHAVPLAFVAPNAPVFQQAVRAVGVDAALEDGEGGRRDRPEEDQHDGHEPLQGAIDLHLQLGELKADQV